MTNRINICLKYIRRTDSIVFISAAQWRHLFEITNGWLLLWICNRHRLQTVLNGQPMAISKCENVYFVFSKRCIVELDENCMKKSGAGKAILWFFHLPSIGVNMLFVIVFVVDKICWRRLFQPLVGTLQITWQVLSILAMWPESSENLRVELDVVLVHIFQVNLENAL